MLIVTDRLASYAPAKAVVMPSVSHLRGWRQNNRIENSHQSVRQRERGLRRFKSLRHAARYCSVFSTVCNQLRLGRHALTAPNYRTVMRRRWREWDVVSEDDRVGRRRVRSVSAEMPGRVGHAPIQRPPQDGAVAVNV